MAVDFDAGDYLQRTGLFQAADSKKGTLSVWLEPDATTAQVVISGDSRFAVNILSGGVLQILGKNASDTTILDLRTSTALAADTWYHVAASWDLSLTTTHIYLNRTSVKDEQTATDDTLDYTLTTWKVGDTFNGALDQVAFWPGVYADLSDADVLRRFVSSDGLTDYANPGPTQSTVKPVGFGADASLPTGTRPIVYYGGAFAKNLGTGGDFDLVGSLDSSRGPAHYRQHALWSTPGERWFDSDRSGFSSPRSETFIEDREGIPAFGQRLRTSERDETTRLERPSMSFSRLVAGLDEDDGDDDRR